MRFFTLLASIYSPSPTDSHVSESNNLLYTARNFSGFGSRVGEGREA